MPQGSSSSSPEFSSSDPLRFVSSIPSPIRTVFLLLAAFLYSVEGVTDSGNTGAQVAKPNEIERSGRNIHVGVDAKTIQEAIKMAQPGDTIHLEPIVYRDYAGFYGKKGELGKPVILDGHGATLEGSDPIDLEKWREVEPGLFANDALLPKLDEAILSRWFFVWNGEMNHMGRTSKGKKAPFKKLQDLQPGEWTFVVDKERSQSSPKQLFGTFYLKLRPGEKLATANIAAPMRSAGVQLSGDNAHLIIRNITATHPYNDGFNIHGDCRDVVFENIRAIECGDDGISAHESAEYRVEGLVSIGNSTGITDTVAAQTSYKNVFIADCHAYDLFFLNNGRYKLENAVVWSVSEHPFSIGAAANEHVELDLENVLIRRADKTEPALVQKNATLRATRMTLENMEMTVRGVASFDNCLVNGKMLPEGVAATGADKISLIRQLVPSAYQARFQQP